MPGTACYSVENTHMHTHTHRKFINNTGVSYSAVVPVTLSRLCSDREEKLKLIFSVHVYERRMLHTHTHAVHSCVIIRPLTHWLSSCILISRSYYNLQLGPESHSALTCSSRGGILGNITPCNTEWVSLLWDISVCVCVCSSPQGSVEAVFYIIMSQLNRALNKKQIFRENSGLVKHAGSSAAGRSLSPHRWF